MHYSGRNKKRKQVNENCQLLLFLANKKKSPKQCVVKKIYKTCQYPAFTSFHKTLTNLDNFRLTNPGETIVIRKRKLTLADYSSYLL